jgi:hypothetical protein
MALLAVKQHQESMAVVHSRKLFVVLMESIVALKDTPALMAIATKKPLQ